MRRNLGVGMAIVIALALALVASNFTRATGGSTATGGDRDQVQTIRLTATSFADKDIDLNPPDLSLGDYFVATENLFRQGTKVGTDHATCTITRLQPRTGAPKRFAAQCLATLVLPEGQGHRAGGAHRGP